MTKSHSLVDELRPYVADERVLAAIAAVPRECFVPAAAARRAYENSALGIGCGQTISQPLVVARMSELLSPAPDDRVLDVGTGSGYHAAVLAALAAHVWSIERHARLSRRAARNLAAAGVRQRDARGRRRHARPARERALRRHQRRRRRQHRGARPSSRPSSHRAGA